MKLLGIGPPLVGALILTGIPAEVTPNVGLWFGPGSLGLKGTFQ